MSNFVGKQHPFNKRRVAVTGTLGRILFYVHPLEAQRMLKESQVGFVDHATVAILGGLASLPRADREEQRPSASSLKSTFIQRLNEGRHRIVQHKYIPVVLKPLYNTPVEECIR
jgi:hypothetical protein